MPLKINILTEEKQAEINAKRKRGYMLTINNPTDEDFRSLMVNEDSKHVYTIHQLEEGEEGTPHIQAFIYYKNAVMFSSVKKQFPRAHIEASRCIGASIKYCSKEDTRISGPFEFGDKPQQGKRTDIADLLDAIKSGLDLYELCLEFPDLFIKYHRAIQLMVDLHYPDRISAPTVTWIYGKSRTGKTHSVASKYQIKDIYIKDGTSWWNGYHQQPVILIDDFDGLWPFRDFLRFLDYLPYQGQYKGGYIKINSPHVYITSEYPPDEYYQDTALDQIMNRIDVIDHMTIVYDKDKRKRCTYRKDGRPLLK